MKFKRSQARRRGVGGGGGGLEGTNPLGGQ